MRHCFAKVKEHLPSSDVVRLGEEEASLLQSRSLQEGSLGFAKEKATFTSVKGFIVAKEIPRYGEQESNDIQDLSGLPRRRMSC